MLQIPRGAGEDDPANQPRGAGGVPWPWPRQAALNPVACAMAIGRLCSSRADTEFLVKMSLTWAR